MKTILYNDDKNKKNVIDSEELYNIENHFDYIECIYNNGDFIYNKYIHKELKKNITPMFNKINIKINMMLKNILRIIN